MMVNKLIHCLAFCTASFVTNVAPARAQNIEAVGSRALGMGGAFVAVASDSSATWWNPAGLAAGPFLDLSLARAVTESRGDLPARRDTAMSFALATPPFGISYYRLRLTEIQPLTVAGASASGSTVTQSGSREIEMVRSLAASQFGVTLVQTILPGLHAGATLKYVRGTVRAGGGEGLAGSAALLDRGDALDGEEGDGAFGMDIGLLGVAGGVRAGLLIRNAVEATLENAVGVARLERQVRAGLAFDARAGGGPPLVLAADTDLTARATVLGDRRNVALGAEGWLWNDRLAIRGGGRFNTAGAKERAATVGASVAVRAGLFVDAHAVGGGAEDERGWGVAARVSF